MNELDPMKVVLSVVDPKYPKDIPVEEISKDGGLLKSAIKLAERNGLYYCFVRRLRELNPNLSSLDEEYWDRELQKLSALKKTLAFLNDMQKNYGIDYILIKACTKIPHVPRDVDILVRIEDRKRIYDLFEHEGLNVVYSNPVETAFSKEGYMKLDIYSMIQYIGMNFIDDEFLWNSKVEDKMFGIKYPSLNDEANFILLLVHSLFGHRSMTLLDFLHIKALMSNIDKRVCREHTYEKGWGAVFDMGLERLEYLYKRIYKDEGAVSFPYLFDRKFMLKRCHHTTNWSMVAHCWPSLYPIPQASSSLATQQWRSTILRQSASMACRGEQEKLNREENVGFLDEHYEQNR